jgi:HlyD family secretion protein
MLTKFSGRVVWIVSALIVAGVGAGMYFKQISVSADDQDTPPMQTSVVRKGDIEVIASGSGTLIAEGAVSLGFATSAKVAELHVRPGDVVAAGDLMAVQADIDGLEMAVYSARIALLEAEESLEDVTAGSGAATASAQLALAEAKDTLKDAEYYWYVNQEGNRAGEATLLAAEANLTLAEIRLEKAKDDFDRASSSSDAASANAQASYAGALQAYQSQLAAWNWYNGHPSEIEQEMLDAEVALAEANLVEAESSYMDVAAGPDQTRLELARLQVARAQADLASAMADRDGARITAPFDGTVLEVSAVVGDNVNADFITVDDLTVPYLDIYIDETDLFLIDEGYLVEVYFDALPDEFFTGTVIQVDPVLYSAGGSSMVHGKVEMEQDEQLAALPVGVSAGVDVIAGRVENVLLVPVEALRDLGGGAYSVFVVDENGELEMRVVEVGLMDITFAEITSGLNQGETVSTGIMETQ